MILSLAPALLTQTGWTAVSPKGTPFSVKMPGKPVVETRSNGASGYTVKSTLYRVTNGKTKEMVELILMHPVGKVSAPFRQALATGFKGGFLNSTHGRELGGGKGKLGDYPGERVSFALASGLQGEFWTLPWKGDLIVVMAVAPADRLQALKKPFFASLRLK